MRVKSAVGSSQECLRVHVKSEPQPDVVGVGVVVGWGGVRGGIAGASCTRRVGKFSMLQSFALIRSAAAPIGSVEIHLGCGSESFRGGN